MTELTLLIIPTAKEALMALTAQTTQQTIPPGPLRRPSPYLNRRRRLPTLMLAIQLGFLAPLLGGITAPRHALGEEAPPVPSNTEVATTAKAQDTALRQAASAGRAQVVQQLLAAGASPNTVDEEGLTPLMLAVTGDNPQVQQIAENGFKEGLGANIRRLEQAIEGDLPTVRALLAAGAAVNAATPRGITALALGVVGNDHPLVEHLLAAGANVNHQAERGETVLMVAAAGGYGSIAKILLSAGADPTLATQDGITAQWVALLAGETGTARIIAQGTKQWKSAQPPPE